MTKWNSKGNLNPDIVLKKIDDLKTISDGKLSFIGFEKHYAIVVLQGMLILPTELSFLNKRALISNAINNVALKQTLAAEPVLKEIKKSIKEFKRGKRPEKYKIATTISLKPPFPGKRFKVEECQIFLLDEFPPKYSDRDRLLADEKKIIHHTPEEYAKVVVHLESRFLGEVFSKGFRALNIFRAILCLNSNPYMEYSGNERYPINKISLGEAHTVHKENGRLAEKKHWYQIDYIHSQVFGVPPNNFSVWREKISWAIKQLQKLSSSYKTKINKSLERYVDALDNQDQNTALIKLWGALESITKEGRGNYDKVIQRCSFLFGEEKEYHTQILEHLREYRNSSVHDGDLEYEVKEKCYFLQFYYSTVINFHLTQAGNFSSLEEANRFLDLSPDKSKLVSQKELIEKAIGFFS